MDDRELEQAMRDGLERRAQRADVAVPVADRARTDVRRRRAGRLTAGLAAAAVVAVAGTLVALDRDPGPDRAPAGPPVATDPGSPLEGAWRTEYWRDLAVDVPDSWGWGPAPVDGGGAELLCGEPIPHGSPGGQGYVGRPVALSDVCAEVGDVPVAAPYLWLGSELAVGTRELADGYVQETVEVEGSRLTVATDDPALRERILDSATGGETCMSELDVQEASFPRTVRGDVWRDGQVLNVCVYQSPETPAGSGRADLVYASTLAMDRLHAYLTALEDGEKPRDQCPTLDYAEGEWVVLEIGTEDGDVIRRDVVHLFCPGIDVGSVRLAGLETVRLTPDMVEPWGVGGIPAVVYGPSMGDFAQFGDYFIGPQG